MDSLSTILQTQLNQAASKLQSQAQLNIHFDPNVFPDLANVILSTQKYGEAIEDLVENHFFSVLLDARARGDLF